MARIPGVEKFLNSIARTHNQNDGEEACPICMDEYKSDDSKKIVKLACKHMFHLECMMEWVQKNDICPMCRAQI